ncbi:MAG: MarC family protein [Puniceicoccales bacterium]|jgi:multiple antibiotic resistance protein|nr:MarC family protein [Puniceicoccales bacterium]
MENIGYIQTFGAIIVQIYLILNPPTAITILLGISKNSTTAERLQAAKQICTIGCILLFGFALFGQVILNDVFHISTEAFQVGGGLFLLFIGLSMATAKSSDSNSDGESKGSQQKLSDLVITPLATPLLVGPGTMTATLVKRMELPDSWAYTIIFYLALAVTMFLVYFTFVLGCKFSKYLTPMLLKIIEKLVGILLLCIATSSILSGTKAFLQSL